MYKDDVYFARRISAVKGNILGLKITKEKEKEEIKFVLIDIKPFFPKDENAINKENVLNQVMKIWNLKINDYYISEIHFAPNDSFSEHIYSSLTQKIIDCFIEKEKL